MLTDGLHHIPKGKISLAITNLEMRAACPQRPVPTPDGVALQSMAFDPDSYRDLFRRVGTEWLWYSRLTMSDDALAAHFADPGIHLFTLVKEGQAEAMLELDFRIPKECELAFFGLTAPLIGSGAGRYLMNEAIRLAWAQPIERFHLHTCNYDSPGALAFYLRSGFVACGREIEIDDDPRVTGALPETAAPHVPLIRA